MGDLIHISELRDRRRRQASPPVGAACRFHFDLSSPLSYLAAERVESVFAAVVEWVPAWAPGLTAPGRPGSRARAALESLSERRAAALRLGLVWPDGWPARVPGAMRAAAHASEAGRGAAFVLAAGRLAFCGGFSLDEPEILAEAAAAAGLDADGVIEAAADRGRDVAIQGAGRRLLAAGADHLPVIEVDGRRFCGEDRLEEAARGAMVMR
jgi:2-hydroxychromene-2-carboxylate isomerase